MRCNDDTITPDSFIESLKSIAIPAPSLPAMNRSSVAGHLS